MWNKRGSVTIEALVTISTLLILLLVLFQLLVLHSQEELNTQEVYEAIEQVELANFVYEKVGWLDSIPTIDHPLTEPVYQIAKQINSSTKKVFLRSVFVENLTAMSVDELTLENNFISGCVSVSRPFVLGKSKDFKIYFKRHLWLFGNQPEVYPNQTLGSLLQKEKEKHTFVFITKTGAKYHHDGCFYLRRSTTDHSKIRKITLKEAKDRFYQPCQRCSKGE